MILTIVRTIDPYSLTVSASFSAEDTARAFPDAPDPDDPDKLQLFFNVYGPEAEERPVSVRYSDLSEFAKLVEVEQAVGAEVSAEPEVPKP